MRHSSLHTPLIFVLTFMYLSIQPLQALADNISGADRVLCATLQAMRCTDNAVCESGSHRKWNIPDFIEIDLVEKQLQTTAASGEKRITPIETLVREGGHIFIQGIDKKRLFSIVIAEQSGDLTAAMPSDRAALAVFAVCTPLR
ncbi:hypothetical protein [Amphritea sp. HPY]|uniref:hypothetical protein n=1 Tax=Amphritea sp. HPY TaxID=3421652 RepID=UPI003D7C507B